MLRAQKTNDDVQVATDTARIQRALDLCDPRQAVVLESSGTKHAFVSAPLLLPRGVMLFIERGITLYASRDPRDYDLRPRSCGLAAEQHPLCKPFLYAYQAAFSGVAGEGTIVGPGSVRMTGGHGTWWHVREETSVPAHEGNAQSSVPDLIASYESQNFSVRGVHLKNAAGDSIALYKTIGFRGQDVTIDSRGGGDGVLLSNSPDATLGDFNVRVAGAAVDLRASILGSTSHVSISGLRASGGTGIAIGDPVFGKVADVRIDHAVLEHAGLHFDLRGTHGGMPRDVQFSDVCLSGVRNPLTVQSQGGASSSLPVSVAVAFGDVVVRGRGSLRPGGLQPAAHTACPVMPAAAAPTLWTVDRSDVARPGRKIKLVVAQDGSGDFRTIQRAVDALPDSGGSIAVKPGTYREVVTIRKPHVHLFGAASDPEKTEIVFNNTGPRSGGTFNSATVFVEADNDSIDGLTIANDAGSGKGQAVALSVTGDRAVFHSLRLLGAQDTLFAASRYCYGDYGPCVPARQYFSHCYIAGNVDFIFGDGSTVFDDCELHGIPGRVMYSAQDRHTAEQHSGYIFDHCRLTADARSRNITLGRPWRPYATVIYLHAQIDAPVIPAGWTKWPRFGVPSLPTAYFAEYDSTGPGANPAAREPYSHQLTTLQAAQWSPLTILAGRDGWNPMQGR